MKVIKQEEFEAIAASGQDPIIVVTCMSLRTVFLLKNKKLIVNCAYVFVIESFMTC